MPKCPFATWMPLPWSPGPYKTGPFKIVHHTTEGETAQGAFDAYRARHDIPHFTVDGTTIYQHLDTDVAASALAHPYGTVETNLSSAIQFEVVGFAAKPKSSSTLGNVRKLCRWIETTHDVPPEWPSGYPKPAVGGKDPGGHNRSEANWTTKAGHYGHCHVPNNTHWDPGYTAAEVASIMEGDARPAQEHVAEKAELAPMGAPVALPASVQKDYSGLRLGKRRARRDPRVPMLSRYMAAQALPAPPASVDYYSKLNNNWGMMRNDKIGDCTSAALAHIILQWTTYVGEPRRLTDDQVESLYEAVGGYNPQDPQTDAGAVEVDVLNYWMNEGAYGDRIAAYASLEVGNITEIQDAINWFGNVYIGLALPVSARSQLVWAVPPGGAEGEGAPGSWGGHAVPVVGYDQRGLTCVTWGETKRMTYEFWRAYCDEAYILLSRDFVDQNEKNPIGLDWAQLEADMALLRSGFAAAKVIKHI